MNRLLLIIAILCFSLTMHAQDKLEWQGQLSSTASLAPKSTQKYYASIRYIPEISYTYSLDTFKKLDFEFAPNIQLVGASNFMNDGVADFDIQLYRFWGRYSDKHIDIRAGFQKVEFGSATILRPLQWFTQFDPRDPLGLATGVYGVRAKYSFINNANIWLWTLYGNSSTRPYDTELSNPNIPEIGGRAQLPLPIGEIALSYHHRKAEVPNFEHNLDFTTIPEHRIGLDSKVDIGIGLWFEAAHIWKTENAGIFTHQSLATIGIDYTFGLGNGLNFIVEHMIQNLNEDPTQFDYKTNTTAATLAYPLTLFDNISSVFYYNWESNSFAAFINYAHDFNNFTTNIILFSNPEQQASMNNTDLFHSASGPGIRLMVVYNH